MYVLHNIQYLNHLEQLILVAGLAQQARIKLIKMTNGGSRKKIQEHETTFFHNYSDLGSTSQLIIIVKTPTQRQLNNNSTKVGFDMKMTLHTTPPTTETQCLQYLSCY